MISFACNLHIGRTLRGAIELFTGLAEEVERLGAIGVSRCSQSLGDYRYAIKWLYGVRGYRCFREWSEFRGIR